METRRSRRSVGWPVSAWVGAGVILLVAAAATSYANFTGGPSVRVTANVKFDIRYIADFAGEGKVEVFDNPDGLGAPVAVKVTPNQANDHTLTFEVNAVVQADTKYYFRVTHHDPTGLNPDEVSQTPLPPVFTGAQAITNLRIVPTQTTAEVSWDANVIGAGKVEYGSTALDQSASDTQNIQNHAFTLTNLQPDTVYQVRASNNHAIDGGMLAELMGSFRTLPAPPPDPAPTTCTLSQPHAEPRTVDPGLVSTLSVRAQEDGRPVAGALVSFEIQSSSKGSGTLSSSTAPTDANGIATVQFTAGTRGNVHVKASTPNAHNSHEITVVVRKS